jgi:hypothetical protein
LHFTIFCDKVEIIHRKCGVKEEKVGKKHKELEGFDYEEEKTREREGLVSLILCALAFFFVGILSGTKSLSKFKEK